MQTNNAMGAPFDPEPDEELPETQRPLNEDYLDSAVSDVPQGMLDNPEDIPMEEKPFLREAVEDDMPGDTEDAIRRERESPNTQKNREDDPSQYDSDRNPDPEHANLSRTVDDVRDDDEPDHATRVG